MLFPVGINQSYAQATVEVMVTQSPDFAPDQDLTYPIGSPNTLTIPFSTFVNVADTDYDDLTIAFTFGLDAAFLSNQFTGFTGVNATGPLTADDNTLLVTADTVTMTNTFASDFDDPLNFHYIVTNTDGAFDRGVISFTVINSVIANPHTVTLPNLLDLTELDLEISSDTVTDILLLGTTFGNHGLLGFSFTTNGTGVDDAGGGGNASGTLIINNPSNNPMFLYTPVPGFAGTEAFSYNVVDPDGNEVSSTLYIVVPEIICSATPPVIRIDINNKDMTIFGLVNGEQSAGDQRYTIVNTGNVLNQPLISGVDWTSDADTNVKTMLAKETRYGTVNAISYDDRTPLTSEPAIISNANPANAARVNAGDAIETGAPLGLIESGSAQDNRLFVFFQIVIDLIDSEFEGSTTQQLTITTANCPTNTG